MNDLITNLIYFSSHLSTITSIQYSHIAIDFAGAAIHALMIARKAFALIGCHAVAIATVGNAHGLAAQGIRLPEASRIALGADAFARLQADLVVAAGGVTLRLAEALRAIQLVASLAATGAIQVALAMRAAQRTGGHTLIAIVEHEVREALAPATGQTEAILPAALPTIRHTSGPIVLVSPPALAADLDDIEVRIGRAIAHDLQLFVVLKENSSRINRKI